MSQSHNKLSAHVRTANPAKMAMNNASNIADLRAYWWLCTSCYWAQCQRGVKTADVRVKNVSRLWGRTTNEPSQSQLAACCLQCAAAWSSPARLAGRIARSEKSESRQC